MIPKFRDMEELLIEYGIPALTALFGGIVGFFATRLNTSYKAKIAVREELSKRRAEAIIETFGKLEELMSPVKEEIQGKSSFINTMMRYSIAGTSKDVSKEFKFPENLESNSFSVFEKNTDVFKILSKNKFLLEDKLYRDAIEYIQLTKFELIILDSPNNFYELERTLKDRNKFKKKKSKIERRIRRELKKFI